MEDKKTILDVNQIKRLIPHRYPFLLVDKVIDYKKDEYIHAIKNVTANEEFFMGHFPNYPIMPGVLIVEALAQASAIFYLLNNGVADNNKAVFFMGIDECKFRKPVLPGDTLKLVIKPIQGRGRVQKVKGEAFNGDVLVCEAILTAMMEA